MELMISGFHSFMVNELLFIPSDILQNETSKLTVCNLFICYAVFFKKETNVVSISRDPTLLS